MTHPQPTDPRPPAAREDQAHSPEGAEPELKDSLISPIRAGNTLEATFESVLGLIQVGAFAPGECLPPERELAAQLGVSRSTLRSVLVDLQEAGYLESRRGRYGGTFVTQQAPEHSEQQAPNITDIEAVLRYREVVEPGCARIAALSDLTSAQRKALVQAREMVSSCPPEHYRRLDSRFHLEIARCCGSPHLVEAMLHSRTLVNDLLDRIPLLSRNLSHSDHQHQILLEAILRGDAETAEATMFEHIEGTASLLRGFLS